MARKRPKPVHQMTEGQFEAMFPDEQACGEYLVKRRWPDGVVCPRCGNVNVFPVKTMTFKWQCYECEAIKGGGYRFSHIAGTIFENTNKPLRQWFKVVHLMLTSKKGISALQIQRHMGFGSYETAHSMCHKIRAALIEPETKLGGIVEVDETLIGGLAKNKHKDKRGKGLGTGGVGKEIVAGAVRRALRDVYKTRFKSFKQRADLYVAFIEHALGLLEPYGQLAFLDTERLWQRHSRGVHFTRAVEDRHRFQRCR